MHTLQHRIEPPESYPFAEMHSLAFLRNHSSEEHLMNVAASCLRVLCIAQSEWAMFELQGCRSGGFLLYWGTPWLMWFRCAVRRIFHWLDARGEIRMKLIE